MTIIDIITSVLLAIDIAIVVAITISSITITLHIDGGGGGQDIAGMVESHVIATLAAMRTADILRARPVFSSCTAAPEIEFGRHERANWRPTPGDGQRLRKPRFAATV